MTIMFERNALRSMKARYGVKNRQQQPHTTTTTGVRAFLSVCVLRNYRRRLFFAATAAMATETVNF